MNALTLSNWTGVSLALVPKCIEARDKAVEAAREVVEVADDMDEASAFSALEGLNAIIKETEESRQAIKEPVLTLGKQIDSLARGHVEPAESERTRLKSLMSRYQSAKREAARIAEEKRLAELRRMEEEKRQREESERKAKADALAAAEAARKAAEAAFMADDDNGAQAKAEADAKTALEAKARAEAETKAAAEAEALRLRAIANKPPPPSKPKGMRVADKWCFEVTDAAAVYAARPGLVRLEVSPAAVNREMAAGMRECPGLKIWSETQVG